VELGVSFRVVGALLFVIVATANGAGYRYGVSDQAFYIPAVLRALDPAAFPRDAPLIDSQARLMVLDELLAAVMGATGLPLQTLFAAGYLVSLILIYVALLRIGGTLYRSRWATIALVAAFTLRHRITRTSANTFEPYFHPRMLAFAFGALAIAAVLRRRSHAALALVVVASIVHITTGLWFAVLVGTALLVVERSLRPAMLATAAAIAIAGGSALLAGPLRDGLVAMDGTWRQAVSSKDSLFPHEWPAGAWVANLGTAGVLGWAWWRRRARDVATPEDNGLAAGAAALFAVFVLTLPFVTAGVALFVQLQVSRVFWLLDLLALVYLVSVIDALAPVRIRAIAAAVIAFAVVRGAYALVIERPERDLFAFDLPSSSWTDATAWLARQPTGTHVLADPGHAWKYGLSVRVAAGRDVFLEDVKDTAIAMYSRPVAVRVVERINAIGDFDALTPARVRELAAKYELDYLVTTAEMELPVAYRNGQFTIYLLGRGL
jgi:hypothetical protein